MIAVFVPDYSDGLTPDFNGIPFYALEAPETNLLILAFSLEMSRKKAVSQ